MAKTSPFTALSPFAGEGIINVIVETPAGSSCKFKFEEKAGLFTISKFLPAGFVFPFDFGFVPGTRAKDGDPVDVMLIAETGTVPGCLVPARLLGALEAEQTQKGLSGKLRNDRLLAIPLASREYAQLTRVKEIPGPLREQIDYFLTSYGVLDGKTLRIIGLRGAKVAARLIRQARSR